jgi:hypothetical protein
MIKGTRRHDKVLILLCASGTAINGAVLDVNLYPVADAFAEHAIGFIFATGYGADAPDGAYRHHPRCEKPFDPSLLVSTLAKVIDNC